MSVESSYGQLPKELLEAKLEQVNAQYWDALDFLANIVAEQTAILNVLRGVEIAV